MPLLHRIRLQGPWQAVPPGDDSDSTPADVSIPASWQDLFGQAIGTAILRRGFNRPTGLEPGNRVFIRLPAQSATITRCSLNGIDLEASSSNSLSYDAIAALQPFNLLEILLQRDPGAPADSSGLVTPVLLEIHD
jgi:hypothetical protein